MPVTDYSKIAEKPASSPMPDYSSIAEKSEAAPPPPQEPAEAWHGATMHADTRSTATRWLDELDSDLRGGGSRTVVGRALGYAQGRGDKGYSGLESGTTKGVADTLGSVPLGAVKTAQGIAETPEHPVKGPLKAVSGVAQMATLPAAFMGGPALNKAVEAIPNKAWAAEAFKDVEASAANVPVNLSRSSDAILRAKNISDAGASFPQAVRKLLSRATDPNKGPLTYSEARDFYSNISSLSANETSRISPIMRRQVGLIKEALKHDIGDAAGQVGQAAKYYAAMKDYAQASKLLRALGVMKDFVVKPVVRESLGGGAGAGLAWYLLNKKK